MMKIIPAIDLIDGKCVRLTKGDFRQQVIYNENPLEVAKSFEDAGITHLHLVDLQGAKEGKVIHLKTLEELSSNTTLKIDFGGGIKSDEDIENVFNSGALQVNIGSVAVKQKPLLLNWLQKYGGEKIILSADVNDETIAINGWEEKTSINLFNLIKEYTGAGLKYVTCTDIAKDGALQGPSFELYRKLIEKFPAINFIASGGVTSLSDVEQLSESKIYGAIIGKAIYENRITLQDFKKFLQ